MPMRTHELHPSMVHAPLALLPMTAFVDLAAATRPHDRRLDRLGTRLWWTTAGVALATGLAGMAASQEVDPADDRTRDMMFLHGIGNLGLVLAAFGMASFRSRHPSNLTGAITGLLASGAAMYTAYLGGEMVYAHGLGVKGLDRRASEAAPLLSGEGVRRLGTDAGRGLAWLVRRAVRAVSGEERIDRGALGPIAEAGTGGESVRH
jgi:uncharacterized membrane protein